VCADTLADADTMLDVIVTLVDHSLLTAEVQGNEARYRMLETVREYALDKLRVSGEEARVREAHAAFFLSLAEQAEPLLLTAHAAEWSARLEHEHDNLRAVLSMPDVLPQAGGLRMAVALWRFWHLRGYLAEGRAWLEQM